MCPLGESSIKYLKFSFYRKSKATAYLLNHEQRHFDITYIYAIELVKRLKSNSCQTVDDAVRIYNEVMNEWELFQDKYFI